MNDDITKKEAEFCRYYVQVRNSREAASLAGYGIMPAKSGVRLLSKQSIREEIARLTVAQKNLKQEAQAGFRRLAFGSVADAIKLIEGKTDNPEGLDLFMISDIKMPKGGGMEIKFFDRQKALESLMELETSDDNNSATPFYKALERSASFLNRCGDEADDEQ